MFIKFMGGWQVLLMRPADIKAPLILMMKAGGPRLQVNRKIAANNADPAVPRTQSNTGLNF
jgi:hypothetical protein